ncbi:PEP-CTERM sorting domain-containing protein [Chamaesiphon sp. VAR_48_metabat_135_sub]|uniref:PEP-CTERM sorting domain-containing protein n=1 Tax=Chamaesiphon sp. VAR_48_metabat_135_sub TaxID=2964699 RepID=UPI00286A5C8D|nr:PEP-CTERM sorting domain-containing protein [Chamaesiphon sp. VAR_48_metabat_135_sub]
MSYFTHLRGINNENIYPPEIAKALALIGFSAFSVLAVAPAQAVVLDFNTLPNTKFYFVGNTYTENGFTLGGSVGLPISFMVGTLSSTALFINHTGSPANLTKVGGGTFTLSSIDLTSLNENQSVPVTFTGTKFDNSTVTQTFTTDSVLSTLETFNFANFTNLVSVSWVNDSLHQFDNICINGGCPAANATNVPEPFTVLGTLFGAGYGVALKRKLAKAKQDKEDIS